MKKYININQEEAIKYNLSLSAYIVLDYIAWLSSWADYKEKDWKIYYRGNPQKVIDDLPILGITTKRWILNVISTLIDLGFIEKVLMSNDPYYKTTDKYTFITGVWTGVWTNVHTGCEETFTLGMNKRSHNSNIIYSNINIDNNINVWEEEIKEKQKSKDEEVNEIYDSYISIIPKDKKQYNKSAIAKKYIKSLLREFDKDSLLNSIRNYKSKTPDKYIMASQYFFSDSSSLTAKTYRPFIDYITEERREELKTITLSDIEWLL